jgi:hypothetical protein
LAALLTLGCAAALALAYWLRANSGDTPGQLVGFLPQGDSTLVYIDVAALRRGGFLDLVSGSGEPEDQDYRSFVDSAKFDYRRDLDAIAAAWSGKDKYLVLRGRFDWSALIAYANRQGGSCGKSFCQVEGSQVDREISFYPLRRDLMALAVSPDPLAASRIRKQDTRLQGNLPSEPVWITLPAPVLRSSDWMPERARPFAAAFRDTQQIVFALEAKANDLELRTYVTCKDSVSAAALDTQLEQALSALRQGLAKQHIAANRADVTGLLAGGAFRRQDNRVVGQWPVAREFVQTVLSGNAK